MTNDLLSAAWADQIGWLLVHSVWQFSLMAVWLAMVLRAMRRSAARLRYGVCILAWSLMTISPAVTWMLLPPAEERQVVSTSAPREIGETRRQTHLSTAAAKHFPSIPADNVVDAARPPSLADSGDSAAAATNGRWRARLQVAISPWLGELTALWLLGVVLFALRPGLGWCAVQRLKRVGVGAVPSSVAAALERAKHRLSFHREVRILQSALAKTPLVIGCLRPVILLPVSVIGALSLVDLESILTHELVHIRRRDYWVNVLQTLTETIFFYHPAIWRVSSCIRREREHCCDELAAQAMGSRVEYGRALLALEEFRGAVPALSLGSGGRSLLKRIERLMIAQPTAQTLGAGGAAMLTLSVILLIGAGAWTTIHARDAIAGVAPDGSKPTTDKPRAAEQNAASSLAAEAPQAGVVRGTLIRASDGSPVAGARVILRATNADYAESDSEGRFQFKNVPPDPRQYVLWAHAGNLVTPVTEVAQTISADEKSARFNPLRLKMSEGRRVTFIVTSAQTGKPLEGTEVKFGYPDRRKFITSAGGETCAEGLLAQEYQATIASPEHAEQMLEIDLTRSAPSTALKVALDAGGIIRGAAVDSEGKPVADAAVSYFLRPNVGTHGDAFRTDAAGRFQHRFVPLGLAVKVSVRHEEFLAQDQEVVLTERKREQQLSFKLTRRPRGISVRGVVKDAGGKPVPGAIIVDDGHAPFDRRETLADNQGEFALDDLVEGYAGCQIHVLARGFAPQRLSVKPGNDDSPAVVDATLKRGSSIRVRIVDELGKPVPGARVTPRSPEYPHGLGESRTMANEEGRFELDCLPDDVRFDISAPGYPLSVGTALPLGGVEPVTVTLEAPGVVRGRVLDAKTGEPVRQFRVQLGFSPQAKPDDRQGTFVSSWSNPGVTFNSDDGTFIVKPLSKGMAVALTILTPGYERAVIERAVAAGSEESQELNVPLEPIDLSRRYTLRGRLVDHAGRTASGAHLRLIVAAEGRKSSTDDDYNWVLIKSGQLGRRSYCDQFLSSVTDSDGRFEFANLPPDKDLQLAYWGDSVPQGRWFDFPKTRAGAADFISIKLPQPGRIRGRLERDQFPDAGSVRLSLASEPFHQYETKLAEGQSAFDFEVLPPGEFWVSVASKPVEFTDDGGRFFRISSLASRKIRLQPGSTEEVVFSEPDKKP